MRQLIRLFYTTVAAILLLLPLISTAQKNEEAYKKYTAAVQQEIWAWNIDAFKKVDIAAADNKTSAVILARHTDIRAATTKKLRLSSIGFRVTKDILYSNTVREMVKINDKAALDEYSQLSFQQFERRWQYDFKGRGLTTIVGARILKPDGKIKEVDVDEAVFVKNEKNDQQRKLAITDLQVGDVIDYFVREEEQKDIKDYIAPQLFVFGDDKPMLHYSVHCEFSDKYAVEYRAMNGAPEFKVKQDDDGVVMDMEMKKMSSLPVGLWMSPYRQVPLVRMNIRVGGSGLNARKAGAIFRNPPLNEIKDDARIGMAVTIDEPYLAEVEDRLKQYNRQRKSKLPKDSLPYFLYYAHRFAGFYYRNFGNIVVNKDRNYWRVKDNQFIYFLSKTLKELDVPHDIVLVTSKYGPAQQEVMSVGDYVYLLRTRGDKPVLISAEGLFTHCAYIPSEYEAQQAQTIDPKYLKINREHENELVVDIPETKATDNVHIEKMVISLENNLQQALVNRTTILKGHMREDEQKRLLLFEDCYEEERQALGVKKSFMEEFTDIRRNKTLAEEYKTAFEKARKEQQDQFKAEIKEQFDQEPKELKAFHIDKMGLRHTDPDFVYTTQFLMEGWVKKAGNNYILDAGKLIGGQLQLKPEQRNRQVDVYMPFARSFEYNIELQIPAGYQLEGVAQLNQQVDNDCGSFIVTASTVQNKLLLTIRKMYKHSYEPVAKWPAMLQMLDAATSFESRKLLLKKA